MDKSINMFEQPEDSVLFLPVAFENYSQVIADFSKIYIENGLSAVFAGFITENPITSFVRGRPQTKFFLTDGKYGLKFTIFGDVRKQVEKIQLASPDTRFFVDGQITVIGTNAYINNAKFINDDEAGSIRPVYPSVPKKFSGKAIACFIRAHAHTHLDSVAVALRSKLNFLQEVGVNVRSLLNIPQGMTLNQVLKNVHYPQSIEMAETSLRIMAAIAALLAANDLVTSSVTNVYSVPPLKGPSLDSLLQNIPFQLTQEQRAIASRTFEKLSIGTKLNILLTGDVGSGKTIVYALACAFVAQSGKRCAILLPNGNLARQIYSEFISYFDLPTALVDANLDPQIDLHSYRVLIGTTAMLYRDVGSLVLCVFDESQKLSIAQQNAMAGQNTHRISVSATPIPRTMALAQYGAVDIERITQCHAQKSIYTRVINSDGFERVIGEMLWTVFDANKQVIVVCARKEDCLESTTDLISIGEAVSMLPPELQSLVVVSHSGLSAEENQFALDSMRNGQAKVLVATSVVEVGITLPEVSYILVLDAQQFGLASLHQIRGRLCRAGGDGWMTLFLKTSKNPRQGTSMKAVERLNRLVSTTDGYLLSVYDMQLRGIGDLLDGAQQHGRYHGFIKNANISLQALDDYVAILSEPKTAVTNENI